MRCIDKVHVVQRRSTRTRFAAALLLAPLVVAACGSSSKTATTTGASTTGASTTGASTTTAAPVPAVNVGVVLSASGAVAQIGQAGQRALAGFEKCWTFKNGGKIHFEIVNDGSDPTQAVAGVDTLVSKKVVALMGFSGGAFSAALPRLLETKLPVVFIPPIPYPNFNKEPYIFSPNIPQVANQLNDFIAYAKQLGLKKLAALTTADAQGDSIAKIAVSLGIPAKQVPVDVTNYQPILSDLKASGVDGLITLAPSGAPPAYIAISKKALGWKVEQFLSPSNLTADFVKLAGDAAEGVRGFIWPVGIGSAAYANDPEQQKTIDQIEKCLPGEDFALNSTLGFYWDNALSIALAIDAAGNTTPDGIKTALEHLEFYGAFGRNARTPTDHGGYVPTNAQWAVLQGGKVILAPDVKRGA